MLKVGMGSSGVAEMIGPVALVEGHDDGKPNVYDGWAESDDMVSNAFRSSMIMGCRFSNSQ